MNTIRVVIADDHPIERRGICLILEETPGIEVVAEAADADQAVAAVAAHRPDVLITEMGLPGRSGLDLAERVTREFPRTQTLVLSMRASRSHARLAMAMGALGYLAKNVDASEYAAAVRAIARGESYVALPAAGPPAAEREQPDHAGERNPASLTPRQLWVLKLVAEGLTSKAVARRMGISTRTVEVHRRQIMQRLRIRDLAGLVRYAIRNKLIDERGEDPPRRT
ncbi:Oxygen regulatory protein NreC [Aquisphaera giovannonii]|uniref:Oxygen regulatory protein NreC n=1 Tax=Aquisphaera giovannonii TaxID=406548 RepID=A0A5B9VUF9_9BACT|nr:response regulator transcription factor [Aquisphaera giovannonii]QEH32023.1 Oxygen regulatory protein NreC [Aquisphaera giovannonii]